MKAIKIVSAVVASLLLAWLIYSIGYWVGNSRMPASIETSSDADKSIVAQVNNYRAMWDKHGLSTDEALNKSAQARANEIAMCGQDCWNHTRPDGREWATSVYELTDYTNAGENLVECATNTYEAMVAWSHSKAHQENMLGTLNGNDWTTIGSGQAYDQSTRCMVYVTHFGRR